MSLWLAYLRLKMRLNTTTNDLWWTTLSKGEKDLIRALIQMVRGAKRSDIVEVARAARKWESGLVCFFKVRLKNQKTRRIYLHPAVNRTATALGGGSLISYPSAGHNQPGVFPSRD